MHKYASTDMHIHTILLEKLLKVKKFFSIKNNVFWKKTIIEKNAENTVKIREKVKQNDEGLSNSSRNCLTNFVDVCEHSS